MKEQNLSVGLFCNQQRARSNVAESWSEDIDEIVAGDRLGFQEAWVSEHTGSPWLPDALPSPDHMICALSRLTSQIRMGPAIRRLALYHPLQVATEAAVCDHLTNGRYMIGFGRGGPVSGWGQRGTAWDETHDMMVEGIDLISRAFREPQPFDFEGRFYRGKDIAVYPKPIQAPSPPVALATGNPVLLRMAAERGYRVLTSQFARPQEISRITALMADALPEDAVHRAHEAVTAVRGVYVAQSDAEALRDVRADWNRHIEFNKRHFGVNFKPWCEGTESVDDIDFDRLRDRGLMWVGSPETVRAGLRRFHEESGGFGTFLMVTGRDWGTLEQRKRSMKLFMDEVVPNLGHLEPARRACGPAVAPAAVARSQHGAAS